eukprot:TRINITY_DN8073_c0_g1_i1.p1 TRINITY_DN8073_c0_g1~~TRINITY_DN8073_c0_g1_i1.p1  ORF type:complete len:1245 (-),score=277.96 TRINITY_DN8073_c0_g1_i1:32-3766(-)
MAEMSKSSTPTTFSDLLRCKIFFRVTPPSDKHIDAINQEISKRAKVLYSSMPDPEQKWGYIITDKPIFDKTFPPKSTVRLAEGVSVTFGEWSASPKLAVAEVRKWHSSAINPYLGAKVGTVGLPRTVMPDEEAKFVLRLINKTAATLRLTKVDLLTPNGNVEINPNFPGRLRSVEIQGRKSHDVNVSFWPDRFGNHRLVFRFVFDNNDSRAVMHPVNVRASEASGSTSSSSNGGRPIVLQEPDLIQRKVIWTWGPGRASKIHKHTDLETFYPEKLDEFPVPKEIQSDIDVYGRAATSSSLNPWSTRDNFKERLTKLLWMEEAEHRKFMRRYDLYERTLERVTHFEKGAFVLQVPDDEPVFRVKVPGLAEKKPSVLYNDSIFVWIPGTQDVEFEGRVTHVETDAVLCIFSPEFVRAYEASLKFNVRFSGHRLQFRLMHRAVKVAKLDVIYPTGDVISDIMTHGAKYPKPINIKSLVLEDKQLYDNPEQMLILDAALNRHFHPRKIPLLVFGAFGCGKTRTLVELTKQILNNIKESRLLICAPSNSAADVFARRLVTYPDFAKNREGKASGLLRFYAMHHNYFSVPEELRPFTTYLPEKSLFDHPPAAQLKANRVIVSTTSNAAALYGLGIGSDFFTHIIIDEAAQQMEPEALVPLSLANQKTTIVLAGDDKQLGPRLYSRSVKHFKLGLSIMERLRDGNQPYSTAAGGIHMFQLTNNYRSHQSILDFPSTHFYGGKLKSVADKNVVNKLLTWKELRNNPKFPVLFVPVEGEDQRDADSPSWYNLDEISQVCRLVKNLLLSTAIADKDVAVISPFFKHNTKLRDRLRQDGYGSVFVGSVEECQGKEFMAVFISTVRASRLWEQRYDRPFSMGFLSDERAMNTAFTRAKALLVVCGDPFVLTEDKHWNAFIQWTMKNDAYKGERLSDSYIQKRINREKRMVAALEKDGLGAAVGVAHASATAESAKPDDENDNHEDGENYDGEENGDELGEEDVDAFFDDEMTDAPPQDPFPALGSQQRLSSSSSNVPTGRPATSAPPQMIPTQQPMLPEQYQAMLMQMMNRSSPAGSPALQQLAGAAPTGQLPPALMSMLARGPNVPAPATGAVAAAPVGEVPICYWGPEPIVSSRGNPLLPFILVDRSAHVDIEIITFNSDVSVSQKESTYLINCQPRQSTHHPFGGVVLHANGALVGELYVHVPSIDFDASKTEILSMRSQVIVRFHRKGTMQWNPVQFKQIDESSKRIPPSKK